MVGILVELDGSMVFKVQAHWSSWMCGQALKIVLHGSPVELDVRQDVEDSLVEVVELWEEVGSSLVEPDVRTEVEVSLVVGRCVELDARTEVVGSLLEVIELWVEVDSSLLELDVRTELELSLVVGRLRVELVIKDS